MKIETLPNFPLKLMDGITQEFVLEGISDFISAAYFVWQLPYGRNTDRSDFKLVLTERQGTCSTKHAILAQLALDQDVTEIELNLGVYEMNETNTPGVGRVLKKHALSYIPEAHCYLKHKGARVDLTHPPTKLSAPIETFLYEETITPDQIGEYKTVFHKNFLKKWVTSCDIEGGISWQKAWRIREECIAALSGNT